MSRAASSTEHNVPHIALGTGSVEKKLSMLRLRTGLEDLVATADESAFFQAPDRAAFSNSAMRSEHMA